MEANVQTAPLPDNVPPDLVVDFDVYAPEGAEKDLLGTWARMRKGKPDIVWTPRNGGHWLPLRFDDIDFMQRNHDPFSMTNIIVPTELGRTRALPIESDPPEHIGYRMIVNPFFTPKKIMGLEVFTRDLAIELIEAVKDKGRGEFMSAFALQLPIAIFMKLTDLPTKDAAYLLELAEQGLRGKPEDIEPATMKIFEYIMPYIEERKKNPGEDLISAVVQAKIKGEPISHEEIMSMMIVILFGGLDTVAASMGFIAEFLGRHPEHRKQLIDDPSLIPDAVYEMMRRFAPSGTARIITRDYDYKGLHFKKGDRVFISNLTSGMDDKHFTNPQEIDFRRKEGEISAFGAGPHRCPGQLLGLLEIRIFIEEWLKRIPDFRVSEDDPPVYGTGRVNCVKHLVLEWNV